MSWWFDVCHEGIPWVSIPWRYVMAPLLKPSTPKYVMRVSNDRYLMVICHGGMSWCNCCRGVWREARLCRRTIVKIRAFPLVTASVSSVTPRPLQELLRDPYFLRFHFHRVLVHAQSTAGVDHFRHTCTEAFRVYRLVIQLHKLSTLKLAEAA